MEIESHPIFQRVAIVRIEDAGEHFLLQGLLDSTGMPLDTFAATWLYVIANSDYPKRFLLATQQLKRVEGIIESLELQVVRSTSALDERTRKVCDTIISFAQINST